LSALTREAADIRTQARASVAAHCTERTQGPAAGSPRRQGDKGEQQGATQRGPLHAASHDTTPAADTTCVGIAQARPPVTVDVMTTTEVLIQIPPVNIAPHSATLVALMTQRVTHSNARHTTKYSCLEAVVLAHGTVFTHTRPVPDRLRGPMRRCYANAQALRHRVPDLVYCAGYALPPDCDDLIFEHAWLMDPDGFVIDPTWGTSHLTGYVGVPLTDAHADRMRRTRTDILLGVPYRQMWAEGLPAGILHRPTRPADDAIRLTRP
jgi:hypothetical protein